MANKSQVITRSITAGGNDTVGQVIPSGAVWVVKKIGGAVPAMNDGYSGNVVLRWGTEIVRVITLYGESKEVDLNKEFVGDGTTEINIFMQNTSTVTKTFASWYDAYERE